jgi:hypothetical protein
MLLFVLFLMCYVLADELRLMEELEEQVDEFPGDAVLGEKKREETTVKDERGNKEAS